MQPQEPHDDKVHHRRPSSTTPATTPAPDVDQKLSPKTFGAITEYTLSANRTPSGIAVAPDGSVWFGEWGLPGVAHLFPNGTLTEYQVAVPRQLGSISSCGQVTNIWGVALWNGSVWGTDFFYSRLVGVNPVHRSDPADRSARTVPRRTRCAVSPNNYLWFTESKLGAPIGKVSPTNHAPSPTTTSRQRSYWESVYMLFKNEHRRIRPCPRRTRP